MNTTLVIMAAGMGSRFGGLKQIESVGPNGETIFDYSVSDAQRAGFDRVIFIIREEILHDFEAFLLNRYPKKIKIEWVIQQNSDLINPSRIKPWGTAHAILAVEKNINTPFAIINADDYYGSKAFKKAYKILNQDHLSKFNQGLISYRLSDTISSHGTVSRGVCELNEQNELLSIREIENIEANSNEGIFYLDKDEQKIPIDGNTLVSMNFWCFQPVIFKHLREGFDNFLSENKSSLKAEYYIPTLINQLIKSKQISVHVESTSGPWFGITYKEDRNSVRKSMLNLIDSGSYSSPLWK